MRIPASLPQYVQDEFESYLKCGRLEHGFLRVQCETCHGEQLVAFSCKRRGFCPSCGAKRMVESAALLVDEVLPEKTIRQWVLSVPYPLRFHMLFLDGVYEVNLGGAIGTFHGIKPPGGKEMGILLGKISERIARLLERAGYLEREEGAGGLILEGFEDEVMNHFQGSSITYKIAVGSQQGRKVLTIKTLPSRDGEDESNGHSLAKASGFSLHAGARRSKMSWAMRLKRVFHIDITVCRHCQGRVRIIACIEERAVIDMILAHRNQQQQSQTSVQVSSCIRAPPIGQSGQMTMNY